MIHHDTEVLNLYLTSIVFKGMKMGKNNKPDIDLYLTSIVFKVWCKCSSSLSIKHLYLTSIVFKEPYFFITLNN